MDREWAGIINPIAPPADVTAWLGWLLAAVVLVLLMLYYRSRPLPTIRRRLRHLQRELDNDQIEPRTAGFVIARALRRAHATARLDKLDFAGRRLQWRQFLTQLHQLQFGVHTPSDTELTELLQQAQEWLRQ